MGRAQLVRQLFFGLAATTASLQAQVVWTVDALNAPGAQFVDIASAVQAASPGDVVLVRAYDPAVAVYQGADLTAGLTVIGFGGQPAIVGALRVLNVPAGEHVVLRDLLLGPFSGAGGPFGDCAFEVDNNVGSVHLQNVDRSPVVTPVGAPNTWRVTNSAHVTMTDCEFSIVTPQTNLVLANVAQCVCVASEFRSTVIASPFNSPPFDVPVMVSDMTLTLLDSQVYGQTSIWTGGTAIEVCNATVEVTGASTVAAGGQVWALRDAAGCSGTSLLRIGPGVSVVPAFGINFVSEPVTAFGAQLDGSAFAARVTGRANAPGLLVVGLPATQPIPLFGSALFLEPSSALPLTGLQLDAQGSATWTTSVPTGLPPGVTQWLQAALLDAGALSLTGAAVVTTS